MSMDQISSWISALFFLWFGLKSFVPALDTETFGMVGAVLAILIGIKFVLGGLGK